MQKSPALKISQIVVHDILLSDIEVGERFRKDMGELNILAASIKKDGLIHPIAVSKNKGEKPYRLIAGGRRLAAITHIWKTSHPKNPEQHKVSCRIFDEDIPELQLRVLEFAENLYRHDMSWQEECNLKDRIHTLQQQIHGKKQSTSPDAPGWSLQDLSKMTGKSKGSLSGDLALAKVMKDVPEVDWSKFATKNDAQKALKLVKKTVKQSTDAAIAKKIIGEGDSLKKKLINSYHIIDFFEGVKKLGNATMDFIEIDPPYAIDLEKQKKDYNYSGYNEISQADYPTFMQNLFTECYRVLKPNRWMVCWFGPDPWFENIHQWLEDAKFKNKKIPSIWVKETLDNTDHISAQCMSPNHVLAAGYEMFFLARKGSPQLNKPGSTNVFGHRPIPSQQKVHPTERPIELITDILNTCTAPGSNILVPFAGSGNTLIAAAQNQMVSIGFDLTEAYFESFIIKVHRLF